MSDSTPTPSVPVPEPGKAPPRIPDYQLLHRVGRGAYGEVWLARGVTGAFRAVKIVHRSSFDNERPFRREFEGILKFEPISRRHESQVDILHVGRRDDYFYYVMELADDQATGGQIHADNYHPRTLKSDLLFRSRLPFEECVSVGIALTTALEHLHENGLVHRDVKPSNIIFVNGVPKLADIGLVTGVDATRSYVGTEGFAAPEGPGTPQADIFSLGKVLYEMGTGKDRQQFPELPTNLRELPDREGLIELNTVIAKSCRHDPRDRYASAAAMRADLELLQSGKSLARLHRAEARLRVMKRLSAFGVVVTMLLLAGWLYQARHTRLVLQLSQRSQLAEKRSRDTLASLQVANGTRLVGGAAGLNPLRSDPAYALAWFAKGLANVEGDPTRERTHRLRIGALLDQHPKLAQQFIEPGAVYRCGFTPDGSKLVTQAGNEIRMFDLTSGDLKWRDSEARNSAEEPHWSHYSSGLAFSPDGKRVSVRSFYAAGQTHVYDLADGTMLRPPQLASGFDPRILDCIDGRTALVQEGKETARLLDLDSGEARSRPFGVSGKIVSGRITPDARHLALIYEDVAHPGVDALLLQVWEAGSNAPISPRFPSSSDRRFLLSADGSKVVLVDIDTARLVKTTTGEEISTLKGNPAAVVINSDNQWLVLRPDGQSRTLFNSDTGESLTLNYSEVLNNISLSPDGLLLATAATDGTARFWNRANGKEVLANVNHASWCYSVAFSADGEHLATSSEDHSVRVWDVTSCRVPRLLLRLEGSIFDAAFSPDGQKIATLSSPSELGLRIWDARTGMPWAAPRAAQHYRPVPGVARRPLIRPRQFGELQFSPDGRRVLVGATFLKYFIQYGRCFFDAGAWVYDTDGTNMCGALGLDTNAFVINAEFDRGSKRVLTGGDGKVKVWDARTGTLLASPNYEGDAFWGCFLPDTNHVAVAVSNSVHICDLTTGQTIRRLIPSGDGSNWKHYVQSLSLSPDERVLAAGGSDQKLYLWDLKTDQPVSAPLWHGDNPLYSIFSRDAKFVLAFSANPLAKVWKLGQAEPFLPGLSHDQWVSQAEFNSDGRYIATSSNDGYARLWDSTNGDLIFRSFEGGAATSARFDPLTGDLLTAGWEGRVRVWKPSPCEYPVGQVAALADLLLCRKMDSHGSCQPLTTAQMEAEFRSLSRALPKAFRTTASQRACWHENLAILASNSKLWKAVVFHISHTLELQPSLPESPTGDQLLMLRGNALAELGRYREAQADFERAVRLGSANFSTWEQWAMAALAQNDTNSYREICHQALAHFSPLDPDALWLRAALAHLSSYPGLVDYGPALGLLRDEGTQRFTPTSSLTFRGKLRYREGDLHGALSDLKAGDPSDAETGYFSAIILHRLGKPNEARRELELGIHVAEQARTDGNNWYARVENQLEETEAKAVLNLATKDSDSPPNPASP